MKIEIESIAINVPWWLALLMIIAIISKLRIRSKGLLKLIKDWIKDD